MTKAHETARSTSLAEMLFPHYGIDWIAGRELEQYRQEYETAFGPTDLTRRYTSTWPKDQQQWLVRHEPKAWFDGLPPFAKAYMRGKLDLAASRGGVDYVPDYLIRLYVSKEMRLDSESRGR